MIKARHHFFVYPLFRWLTRFLVNRNFRFFMEDKAAADNGKGVLILANHTGWWDGFWLEYLNQKTIRRKLHFMMLEEQLHKHWYFQLTGGFSVKKGSREVVQSLAYTAELLSDSGNMVIMFPQGRIVSSYSPTVAFEKGVQTVIDRLPDDTQVLLVANFTDYFSSSRPGLYVYTRMCLANKLKDGKAERVYNDFYSGALAAQNKQEE